MPTAKARVPATSANLGPGFDCLGVAVQLYNDVLVTPGQVTDPDPMVAETAEHFFAQTGRKPFSFGWSIIGEVPRSRGLGSSVTVRMGVLAALGALSGPALSQDDLFALCAELEGHPDNAAPAAYGGFTVARAGALAHRCRVGRDLHFVLLIPDFEIETKAARRVLPKTVPLADAVAAAGGSAAITAAFVSRDYTALKGTFDDTLHQPYRKKLLPCMDAVIAAATAAGALGAWLSGSGSTLAAATLTDPQRVGNAMFAAAEIPGAKLVFTQADNTGVRTTVSR
jgi:homoserine kinase